MKKYFIFLIAILSFNTTNAQWAQKSSMYNYGRRSAFGCSLNGYGYVGLGTIYGSFNVDDVWKYDPITNNWTQKPNFPGGGRNGATAYAVNGKIYLFFGIDNSYTCHNDVWEYNPITDSWLQKNSLPAIGRYNAEGFVIGDSVIYIGTGSFNSSYEYLSDFWKYSPKTNSWQQVADYQGGKRMCAASFAINNIGYLGTGLYDADTPTKDFWSYNPVNNTWTSIPDFPGTARVGCISFVLKNEGYVGTGDDYNDFKMDFYKYVPTLSSWVQVATPQTEPGNGGIAFAINDIGYFGTGWDKENYFTYFWAFDSNIITEKTKDVDQNNIKIYPNPTSSYLNIETTKVNFDLTIVDVHGQELFYKQITENRTQINIKNLPTGIYFLRIQDVNSFEVKKIIKE